MKRREASHCPCLCLFVVMLFSVPAPSLSLKSGPLEGVNLRCCTLVESPIIYIDNTNTETHGFGGLGIEYLKHLEARLGFRCKTLKLFNATNPRNQGFTGFITEMEECTKDGVISSSPKCQCDIGVGGWGLNQERFGRVDFVPTYLPGDLRMLTHVDNMASRSNNGAFFLTAFSLTAWIAILGLILLFSFIKLFDRKFAPPEPGSMNLPLNTSKYEQVKQYLLKSRLLFRIRKATQSTLLTIIGQSSGSIRGDSKTTRHWFLNYIILLCGLFLVLAYEATMTASLVQETAESPYRNIDDLKTCRVPAREVCIPEGGGAYNLWMKAIASSECIQNKEGGDVTKVKTYEEGHRKVASKQCKYFLASGATTAEAASGKYCGQVAVTGAPLFSAGASYVLPKGSNMTEIFSTVTLELRLLDKLTTIDQYIQRRRSCATKANLSLTFGRLKVFFISAFAVCFLMLVVMIIDPQGQVHFEEEGVFKRKGSAVQDMEHGEGLSAISTRSSES